MTEIEKFVFDLFQEIEDAALRNCFYRLELTPEDAKKLAKLWAGVKWVEII